MIRRKVFPKIIVAMVFVQLVCWWNLSPSPTLFQDDRASEAEPSLRRNEPTVVESSFVGRTMIVAFCNYNYRSVAIKWHKRMLHLGYSNRDMVLVATDEAMADFLSHQHGHGNPKIQYQLMIQQPIPPSAVPERKAKKSDLEQLFALRWKFVVDQLEQGINVLLTDVDNIFSRYIPLNSNHDPFSSSTMTTVTTIPHSSSVDVWHAYATKYPRNAFSKLGFTVCGGMSWWRASAPAIRFAKIIHENCGIMCDDQRVLNNLLADETKLNMTWYRTSEMLNSRITNATTRDKRFLGLPTIGILGYCSVTGHRAGIWDRDFAFRGPVDPDICPAGNWVSMPIVETQSRSKSWMAKLESFDEWDRNCRKVTTGIS
jgi:hypothetical protein